MKKLGFHTRAVRGLAPVDARTGALSTPVYQTASFALPLDDRARAIIAGEADGFVYSRLGNLTARAFERDFAALEGAEDALVFSSGMAAISCLVLAHCGAGDHLLTQHQIYGGAATFFGEQLPRLGVERTYLEEPTADAVKAAIRPNTKLIYLETPSNPLLRILDVEAVAAVARDAGIPLAFDNTFCTPYLSRPIELGATFTVHSATKYMGGHDVVGGALAGPAERVHHIRQTIYKDLGAAPAPQAAYLFYRGLKTLPLRMDRHCANARAFASYLAGHAKVRKVYYPGLPHHPGHDLAARQMKDFGGILAFELGDGAAAKRFLDALELCTFAVSVGDPLTLVFHPPGVTHNVFPAEKLSGSAMGPGFIRISAGLEDADDILADLAQALDKV